jgi:hypothetical protein
MRRVLPLPLFPSVSNNGVPIFEEEIRTGERFFVRQNDNAGDL